MPSGLLSCESRPQRVLQEFRVPLSEADPEGRPYFRARSDFRLIMLQYARKDVLRGRLIFAVSDE